MIDPLVIHNAKSADLREFSRWCANQVVYFWDAPKTVRDYLSGGSAFLRLPAGEDM